MIKPLIQLTIVCSLVHLTGCVSTRGLYDVGGAAAGGTIAGEISHGNPLYIAGGAVAGGVLADAVQGQAGNRVNKAYNAGYDLGKSDAVKQDYWVQQDRQKTDESSSKPRVKYLPVPAPAPVDNTKEVPHQVYVPVVQN